MLIKNSQASNKYSRPFVNERMFMKYYEAVHNQLGRKQNKYADFIFTSQVTQKDISSKRL